MSETTTTAITEILEFAPGTANWIELASGNKPQSEAFYTRLFDWTSVTLGPEAGNYVMLSNGGSIVGAIGGLQEGQAHSAWMVYFATTDADATAAKVEQAGGRIVMAPMDVMDQGRMGVFIDPSGAVFAVWQAAKMPGLGMVQKPNSFAWAELNTRGIDRAEDFYPAVFGWTVKRSEPSDSAPAYTEWQIDGDSVAGAMDTTSFGEAGAHIPPHWLVYFGVSDIEASAKLATDLGAAVQMAPAEFPGGRFAVLTDPAGAAFGLLQADKVA